MSRRFNLISLPEPVNRPTGNHFTVRPTDAVLKYQDGKTDSQTAEYFEQAVARDSRYAPAYVDLGLAWSRLTERNVVPMEEGTSKMKTATLLVAVNS